MWEEEQEEPMNQIQTEQSEDRRGGNELAPDKLDKPSSYT
jgi:hypothetical protein